MGASYSSCQAPVNPVFADAQAAADDSRVEVKPARRELPTPVKYEEVQREAYSSLKWETIDGCKFDVTKPFNPNFFFSHRISLGQREVDLGDTARVMRAAVPEYNFSATVATDHYLLMGTMNHGGVLMSKVIGRPNERVTTKLEARTDPADFSQSVYMADAEWSGDTWSGQVKMGTGGFYGGNAMFAVSEHFSGGAELFSLGKQRRSGMGGVLRYATSKCVGTLQVATTGILSATYHQRVNEKAAVAADLLCNFTAQDFIASIGYDYTFARQTRLRGTIDSQGKCAVLLEEHLGPGVKLSLSGELDHARADHRFGFGMTVGE